MTTMMMQRRQALVALSALAAVAAGPALAQGESTKITLGYTAVADYVTAFVAREEGYFANRKLDVTLTLIPLNPSIPPALQADSIQVGGPTPSVFLQAVDAGLDHVVLAGASTTSKNYTGVGLVARSGSGIKTAQDCVGRKVGVPGLGAYLHVSFRAWLKMQGVDHSKVTFVEASFPQHGDLLRGGSLDAVVTGDPIMSRIVASGVGYVASYYPTFLPEGLPTIVYTARRDWAQKNASAARAFRDAIAEAAIFVANPKNNAKMREHIGKYVKLPPEVLATVQVSPPGPVVTEKGLAWWVDMMRDQKLLKGNVNVANTLSK